MQSYQYCRMCWQILCNIYICYADKLMHNIQCYLVVRLIAISRAYRSSDLNKGHRVGLSD